MEILLWHLIWCPRPSLVTHTPSLIFIIKTLWTSYIPHLCTLVAKNVLRNYTATPLQGCIYGHFCARSLTNIIALHTWTTCFHQIIIFSQLFTTSKCITKLSIVVWYLLSMVSNVGVLPYFLNLFCQDYWAIANGNHWIKKSYVFCNVLSFRCATP